MDSDEFDHAGDNHEIHKGDNHEEREEHEGDGSRGHAMRLPSPLEPRAEQVMSEVIGCAIAVHRALGPGFLESIYRKAMRIELHHHGLRFEHERSVTVTYRDVDIHGQRVDLIVEDLVIVELKAVARFDEVHRAQLISYLKTTGLRGGLLINFRVPVLRDGIRRVVL